MHYLDYRRWRIIVQEFFSRFENCPELRSTAVSRACGYFELSRFFGPGGVDPKSVSIDMQDQPFEFADDRIARFAAEIERMMTAEGRLYPGPDSLKLVAADLVGDTKQITVQPCRYGYQAGSCLALDYEHSLFSDFDGCLREYYLSRCPSRALGDNPLAICLGVSACVVAQYNGENQVLIVRRKARLASLESTFGASVSGSVEIGHLGDNLYELLQRAISAEASEELQLSPSDYRLIPLAYGREIFRGERPQLFAALVTDMTVGELSERCDKLDPATKEFDDYFFVPLSADPEIGKGATNQMNYEAAMNFQLLWEYFGQRDS